MSPRPLEAEDREETGRGRTGAASLLTDAKPAASGPLYPECWAAVCLVSDVTCLQHRNEQAPVASGFKSPLTGRQTNPPPRTCSPGPLRGPRGPRSDQPIEPGAGPLFCASGPPSGGDSTACGSAGARSPPGLKAVLPPGVLPVCPVSPRALPPAGTVGVHICASMRRVHPPRALLPPAPRSPGPPSGSSLVPRALPVSPPQICD